MDTQFNGTQLCLIPVARNDNIVLRNQLFHHIGRRRGDHDLSALHNGFLITAQKHAVNGIYDVGIAGAGLGKKIIVVYIHVGVNNITRGNEALELSVLGDAQAHNICLSHQLPCALHGQIPGYPLNTADLYISYLRAYIG